MTINRVTKVQVLLTTAVIAVLVFAAGCGEGGSQAQDLEEQQQQNEEQQRQNEELQKELEGREKEQQEAEKQEEAERQEELKQEVADLEKKLDESEQQQNEPEPEPESNSESPDVVIESNSNWTAPPSQAPQGVVVVSPNYNVQAVGAEEAQVLDGAIAYYQAAEIGDYVATYNLLSSSDQSYYTLDQWVESNTTLDSAAAEFVVTDAFPEDVGNGYPTYAVTLTAYLPDGSSFDRKTYFTNEGNGFWAHWLNEEEIDMFDGAL